jgi:RecB family exonuclease
MSASDMDTYERCPARWFIEKSAHLPRAEETTDSQLRGTEVHRILRDLHKDNVACSEERIQTAISQSDAIAPESLLPYLRSHLTNCPHRNAIRTVALDQTIYGFDARADTVVATKADMVFLADSTLVIREVKTTIEIVEDDPDAAFDRYLSIAWAIVALTQGLAARFGSPAAVVELEVLTPTYGRLFRYETSDAVLVRMAKGRIGRISDEWIQDVSWRARPGAQCSSCPVANWCDAKEVF